MDALYEVRTRYVNGSEMTQDYKEADLTIATIMNIASKPDVAYVKIYDPSGTWLYSVYGRDVR